MEHSTLREQLQRRVFERINLEAVMVDSDLQNIHTLDGREVGRADLWRGEKLQKICIVEMSLGPGMSYTNVLLKPSFSYNIPKFHMNYMTMPDRIAFDVDLYPAVDLVLRQDYIDRYYARLDEIYLKEKQAAHFDWKLSDFSWIRASASPYFFMATTALENQETVSQVALAYLDAWLEIWASEKEVSDEERKQIAHRMGCITHWLIEREPKRRMLEEIFGKQLTDKLQEAML